MKKFVCTVGLSLLLTALPAVAQSGNSRATRIEPDDNDEWQSAATVVQLDYLQHQGNASVKLFGVAGGDPAMNGLHTFLAFYISPDQGWRVFPLGDFNNYYVISESPACLTLAIREDVIEAGSPELNSLDRQLTIRWQRYSDEEPAPATISMISMDKAAPCH